MAGPARDSIARNVGFSFALGIGSAAFTAVLRLFLIRSLGPEEYGIFALALGIGLLVLLPANLGISTAASRFIAEVRHDRPAVHGVIFDALRLKLLLSVLFCGALAVAAEPIAAAYDTPELTWPIRLMALALLGQGLLQLYDQIFEAEGRIAVYTRIVLVESAVETVASIGLVLGGLGVSGAMAGRAGAYLFAAGFGLALVVRTVGMRISLRGAGQGNVRRLATYGSALLVIDGAFTLFSRIDVLLIGAIIDVEAVGQFEAALWLMSFAGYAGAAAAAGVAPLLARSEDGPDVVAFDNALRRLMLIQGVLIAPLIVWAEPLAEIAFGAEYPDSAGVVRALAPFAFLLAVSPLLARGVTYLGEARRRIPIAIAAVLVNVAIDLALLAEIGIVAGAIGTDVAYVLYVAGHLWLCRRLLGIELRPLARTFAATMVAVAAMSGALLAFGTGSVAIPLLIVGGAVGAAVYAVVLLALGEVTREQLAAIGGRAAALLPRRG